jgi:hypothetical protein
MYRPKAFPHCGFNGRPPSTSLSHPRIDFYREEFLKLQHCLQSQREFFSDRAIDDAECALRRVVAQLDDLCCQQDADKIVSSLLEKFGLVARLAAWSDSRMVH